jgi:DNA-binding transcriptional regulator YdaS (Cro superfamily)
MTKDIAGIRFAVMLAGSQRNLAKVLGVHPTAVNKWVRKGFVPNERIEEIHKLYGIPCARLCDPYLLKLICSGDKNDSDDVIS